MIKTATQLKDLIRNLSKKKSADAQIFMRSYMMERFLERISVSKYQDKFILKGGMLVAAMVGLDARATMDIDATIKKMESIKAHLLTTQNQLRLANNKVEDVSVKKLTYNNPTMKKMFEEARKNAESEEKPE